MPNAVVPVTKPVASTAAQQVDPYLTRARRPGLLSFITADKSTPCYGSIAFLFGRGEETLRVKFARYHRGHD